MPARRTPRAAYKTLHRIADGQIGRVEQAFLRSIQVSREQIDRRALAAALERGDVDAAMSALKPQQFAAALRRALVPVLSRTTVAAATASLTHLPFRMDLRFAVVNQRAVTAAATRTADLIRQVTGDTKANVRTILSRAQAEGITVQGQKRLIREVLLPDVEASHGLTARQWQAVENFAAKLEKRGLDAATIARRKDRYATQQLNRRATNIARTETIRASNLGQQEAWEEARAQGYLLGNERRIWVITPDDRLCPYCRAIPLLNPEGVGLREPFRAPMGGTVERPPAHPQCRCATSLRFEEISTLQRAVA